MYKSHSQGHNMPFLRVKRKGEVLNKHSNYIILYALYLLSEGLEFYSHKQCKN